MVEVKPAWTFVRERRYLALRTGVATAVASVGPSFARGPAPPLDHRPGHDHRCNRGLRPGLLRPGAVDRGGGLGDHREEPAGGSPENIALRRLGNRRGRPGSPSSPRSPTTTVSRRRWPPSQSVARVVTIGAVAGALVLGSDRILDRVVGERALPINILIAGALGAATAGPRSPCATSAPARTGRVVRPSARPSPSSATRSSWAARWPWAGRSRAGWSPWPASSSGSPRGPRSWCRS